MTSEMLAGLNRVKTTIDLTRLRAGLPTARGPGAAPAERSESAPHRLRHVEVHLVKARELLAANDLTRAQAEFSEALLLDPGSSDAHVGLAEIYQRQGRADDAVRALRAALWSGEDARIHVRLARLYLELHRTADARAALRAALKLEPENAEAGEMLRALEAKPAERKP